MGNDPKIDLAGVIQHAVAKYYDPKETDPARKAEKQIHYLDNFIEALSRYLPTRLVKKLSIEPEKMKVEGERRTVTILFADLTGFTAMSETMDPEDVVQVVNEYFTRMLNVVFKYGGAIDKFMGDAILVVFGALETHEDDAIRATLAALEMQQEMEKFNSERKLPVPLSMSIGINTGPVVAVNVGTMERMEFTIMGDNVNLASRLEGVAKAGQVVISQATYQNVKDHIKAKKLPSVKVKGKKKPVVIYLADKPEIRKKTKKGVSFKTRTRLVGRIKELEAIHHALRASMTDSARVVAIIGASGTGKTRLLEESDVSLSKEGFKTLRGDSYSYTSNIAYFPFKQVLTRLFNINEKDTEEEKRGKINSFLAEKRLGEMEAAIIPTLLDLETEHTMAIPPEMKKKYIFESVRNLFASLANIPLCLTFEDLQWTDKLSAELIMFLAYEIRTRNLIILTTFRPEFAFPVIAEEFAITVQLENLAKEFTAQYLKEIFEEREPSEEVTNLVFSHSKGNPLYIEALAKNLAKRRLIRKKEVKIELRKSPDQIRVPDTINSIVMERIDRMDELDQRVLRMASIIGQTFSTRDLTYLLDRKKEEIMGNLESLEHFEGEITTVSNGDNPTYRFNTPTVREVIYNSILRKTRTTLHKRYGDWVLQQNSENPHPVFEILAYHFVNGADVENGIMFSKLAGEKARNYFANEAGIAFFTDALHLLKKSELTEEKEKTKLEIMRRLGYFLMMVGDTKKALLSMKNSLRLANKLGQEKDRIMSLMNIGMLYDRMGVPEKPIRYYRRAGRAARKINLLPLVAMTENNLGIYFKKIGKLQEALEAFNNSLKINRKVKNPVEEAIALENIGDVQAILGSHEEALKNYDTAMKRYLELNAKDRIPHLSNSIARIHLITGNLSESKTYAEKALSLARELGIKKDEQEILGNLGIIHFRMNQPLKAIELYNQALSMAEMSHDPVMQMGLFINIGDVFHTVGDFENAVEYHKKATEIATQIRHPMGMLEALKGLGLSYCYLDRIDAALDNFRKAQEISEKVQDKKYSSFAGALMALFDETIAPEESAQLFNAALNVSREIGDPEMALTLFREASRSFIKNKDYQSAMQNAGMVQRISQQMGNQREFAWAMYLIAVCNRQMNNPQWQAQIEEAGNLSQQVNDSFLGSLIQEFKAQNQAS
jgi:class 3 adenylate cyclase/predicted ATPase